MANSRVILAVSAVFGTSEYARQCVDYPDFGKAVTRDFWKAVAAVGVAVVMTLLTAFAFGKLSPNLPADPGKVCSFVGGAMAALGGWFALANGNVSFKGQRPDEQARKMIFVLTFWPGVTFSLFGALWWQ